MEAVLGRRWDRPGESTVRRCGRLVRSGVRRRGRGALDLEDQLVGVAPPPVLARLVGADERVIGMGAPVGRGVAIGRAVAAPDVPAAQAHPEMDPLATGAETVLT